MKFLVDTNILIALEPASPDLEENAPLAAEFVSLAISAGHQIVRHRAQDADQQRDRDVDQRLDVPAHAQPVDHPVQQPGYDEHLEDERQHRRDVEVRLMRHIAHHGGGGHERRALQGEEMDQREHAPLRDHGEGDEQHERREKVDQLAAEDVGAHERAHGPLMLREES